MTLLAENVNMLTKRADTLNLAFAMEGTAPFHFERYPPQIKGVCAVATSDQILELLLSKTAPISMSDLAKELGLKSAEVSTQLKRLSEEKPGKPALVSVNDEGNYEISDAGRQKVNPDTEVSEGLTEGEIFKNYGIRIGVKKDIVSLVQEHVWNGGEPKDLNWVKKALAEMNIPSDLAGRWLSVWRTYLLRGISPEDPNGPAERGVTPESGPPVKNSKDSDGSSQVRLRDYILDANFIPLYVGEGNGDMDFSLAEKLSILKASRAAKVPIVPENAGGGGSTIDETSKLYDLVQRIAAGNGPKKTTLMIPDGKGGVTIQEVDAGSNVLIPKAPSIGEDSAKESPKGYYLDPETNEMKEINPNKPIVIVRKEVVNSGGEKLPAPAKVFIVEDGELKEHDPSRPIVINRNPPPAQSSPGAMFSIPTGNGNAAVTLDDLNKWMELTFKVEDHKKKVARDEESHEMWMDMGKTLKDFGTKAVRAVGNMGNNEEENGEE